MSEEAEDGAQLAAMEEVKHLTEKLSHLQKEIYSRQNSLNVMQKAIDEAMAMRSGTGHKALVPGLSGRANRANLTKIWPH